jgi:hypothetical protein
MANLQRMEALLSAPNAKAMVRATAAEDLYFAIAEVGLADSTELIQLVSPKQFQTFVDLGGWRRDRMEPHQLLTWLRAARGDDREEFLRKVEALDLELVEGLLRELTVVHDLEATPDVHPEGVTLETPEGKYLVEFKVEGVELFALKTLLQDLIAKNPFEAGRLLEAVRWELPSELEETAYQFRSGRLWDLGFPELEVAMGLYTYLDPKPLAPAEAPRPRAHGLVLAKEGEDYLQAAMQGLDAKEQESFSGELRYLVNASLVAEAAEPGDLEAVKSVTERTRDYLLLGLEHLTGRDAGRAPSAVRDRTAREVFQVGFSLTLELKFRADRLMRKPLSKVAGVEWVMTPEAKVLSALRRRRPLKALKVEGAEPVPFRSLRELDEARGVLDRVEQQLWLFEQLLGPTAEAARERLLGFRSDVHPLTPERVLMGAVAQAALGEAFEAVPLPKERGLELCQKLFEGTPKTPVLREGTITAVRSALHQRVGGGALAEAQRLCDVLLRSLLDELGPPFLQNLTLEPQAEELLPLK